MGGGVLGERADGIMRGRSEIPGGATGWTSTWAWGCIVVATSRIVRSLTLTSPVWMWMFSPVCSLLWLDSQLSSTGYGANVISAPLALTQPRPGHETGTHFCFRGWAGVPTAYGDTTNLYFPHSREERALRGLKNEEEEAASRHGGSGRRGFPTRSGVIGSILAASKEESQRR